MVDEVADPFDETVQEVKTVDDCWEKVPNKKDGGFYNMESLNLPSLLKEKFPDWAEGLKNALTGKEEKEKVEYDGRQYWWSQFNNKKQYNRNIPSAGGASGGKGPSGVTVDVPLNISIVEAKDITQAIVTVPEGAFKRIIHSDRNPDTKAHEFVVETYKKIKIFPQFEKKPQKQEDKKEGESKAVPVEGADEL